MAKANAASRAAKKHEKQKKREKKLAARPPRISQNGAIEGWKPATEGIEGLARRMGVGSHDAAQMAEAVAQRRPEARGTWLPSKVEAMETDKIVAELAERGVRADEDTFVAAAEERVSARALAVNLWKPMMRASATVHDRDFVGQAAEVLWARWAPHHPCDEALRDLLRVTFEQVDEHNIAGAFDAFEATWDQVREDGGLERLAKVDTRGARFAEKLRAFCAGLEGGFANRGRELMRDVGILPEAGDDED
jgi:hypothetical protein